MYLREQANKQHKKKTQKKTKADEIGKAQD